MNSPLYFDIAACSPAMRRHVVGFSKTLDDYDLAMAQLRK
jgi:hypothetical protein